jgi:hypothetical protein
MMRELTLLGLLSYAFAANAAEVVQVRPWELHSSFWMNLHQTLIADAMRSTPRALPALSAEELTAWNEAVGTYRTAGGRGDMTFARPMLITTDALTQVADEATELLIDTPLRMHFCVLLPPIASTGGLPTIKQIDSSSSMRPPCCAKPETDWFGNMKRCFAPRGRLASAPTSRRLPARSALTQPLDFPAA